MNSKVLVGLVVLLVGVGAGWYFLKGSQPSSEMMKKEGVTETTTPPTQPTTTLGSELPATGSTGDAMEKGGVSAIVSYGADGFSPKSVTVKKGSMVRWTNQGAAGMRVASAVHPTHQLLPGFDQLKSVGNGGTYEYTFEKVGTWKFHNHVSPSDTGTVVVTE